MEKLELYFEESFEEIQFEEIVALVSVVASDIEVRRYAGESWMATIWVEKHPGSTWPRTPFTASALTPSQALLMAHAKAKEV